MLTNFPYDPLLDLAPWVGQRQCTYRFERFNGVSGQELGVINPIRGTSQLSHDTGRTIKRQLSMTLGARDTAALNPISDRIRLFMVFGNGQEYPLGVYMFTDDSQQVYTSGSIGNFVLNDEMYLVDQEITKGVDGLANPIRSGLQPDDKQFRIGTPIPVLLARILDELPIRFTVEPGAFSCSQGWGIGTRRGAILDDLALTGDYWSPWFDNTGIMRFIRMFNPALKIPDLDWDEGNQVMREPILRTSNLLNAPNRFVVISNAPANVTADEVVGFADVPPSAPNSFENRGFIIASVHDLQVDTAAQCTAVAASLAQQKTLYDVVELTTAPDPRHDSYNIIKWQDDLWLEIGWSMTLTEGAPMRHVLRRSYR